MSHDVIAAALDAWEEHDRQSREPVEIDPALLVAVSESSAVMADTDRDERRSDGDLGTSPPTVRTLAAAPGAPSSR